MYEWIVDNGMTPHVLVDTSNDRVMIPRQYEEDGRIVLNISPSAVQSLDIGNEALNFDARFDGNAMDVFVPMEYILAIYTRENGQGMLFADEDYPSPGDDDSQAGASKPKAPHLRVVK